MILLTSCGNGNTTNNNPNPENTQDGGMIKDSENAAKDAADGVGDAAKDVTDGAGNAVKDAADGAGNAVKDLSLIHI